jgi:class 3 adenylate cyclase
VEAERRYVTVLFTDMVGYTDFAERCGEEAAYALIQRLYGLMTAAVEEQGGVVNQFTGDGIMALFGVPAALEDAPLRACRAALLMQQRLAGAGGEIEAKHGVRPQLRIGINSGPAVVGQVGASDDGDTTALGDTVNLAARLQQLAEPGAVLLSEQTHKLVQGLIETRFVGEHGLKGKANPQKAYRLGAIRHGTARFDVALSRGLTDYVGRAQELEALERRLAASIAGRFVQAVDIVGEAGIGKSRLLHEFRLRLRQDQGLVLSGNCSADGQHTPYLPLIEAMRGWFRIDLGEAEPEIARRLEAGLLELGLASVENIGLLLHLLGLEAPEGVLTGLDGVLVGLRTRNLLQRLLQACCRI